MMKTFLLTAMSLAWVSAIQLQAQCVNDTTFTDVIYLVDNSGSIDDAEYISFESIITTSIASLQSSCSDAQVAVAHYGGFNGQELIIEHPFSTSPIPNVNRQFCNARDAFNICIGSGGDDLNYAIGAIMDSMATGALSHDMNNNLSLIILTDAFGLGTDCLQPNCSLILPTTNIDAFKAATGVDVTVVGVSDQAEETVLGIYASPGGDFMGPLFMGECAGSFDGCTVPRKYIQAEFSSDPGSIADIITNTVSCEIQIVTGLTVEAGTDQSICTDLAQSAMLTATPSMGLAPFDYNWSTGATSQSITVTPTDTTLYFVTVTDANTCTFTDSVTVFAAPCCTGFGVDAGLDQMICGDLAGAGSAMLSATRTGSGTSLITSYNWNNGLGAGQSQTVSPTVTTTYTVTAMDDIGCIDTDDVEVAVGLCCDGFSVEAGFDQMICQGMGESVNLIAVTTGGNAPVVVTWDQGLGAGLAQTVSPFVTTTYTVTATDNQGCVTTDQVTVIVEDCGPDCIPDTVFTDVIFLIDNSGSIDADEFSAFEDIIVTSLAGIEANCPSSRRAVVHYGGANGTSTTVEHPLDNGTISAVNRQFCLARDQFNICVGGGGDDLNNAIGDIMTFLGDGTLNRNPLNNLSLVILTDAFSFDETCNQPNCSLILPTTNIDLLKGNFGADVSVIGVSEQAEQSLLGIYASPGGDFQGPLFPTECVGSFDGCTVPRKYVGIEFNTPPASVADMITDFVSCQVEVMPVVDVDAGPDQEVCFNLGESATLSVTPLFGTPPFTYLWSDASATTTPELIVTPLAAVSTTFTVTITDANTCTAVDTVIVNGIDCFDCTADAGTPQPPAEVCLDGGQAILTSDPNDGVVIPDGFEELFILANRDRTILDFSIGPRGFIVTEPGLFRVHTLIAEVTNPSDPNFFDLNTIELGVSDLFFIVNCVENHEICIAFDFPGRVFEVLGPDEFVCMEFENSINLCWDGFDNDGDGLVDCADPDCAEVITCLENTLIACNDLTDNDGDGLVDCFDPDCFQFTVCAERGEACQDGIDNDGDGLIDCADSSCDGSAPCLEDSPFTCVDGRDNDGDGLVDCADPQCANFIVCAEFDAAACRDGIDNDFDGLVDCLDSDCRTVDPEFCEPFENNLEKCSDGRDNDFDGLIDCQDPDCQTAQLLAVLDNLDRIIEVENATCMGGDNGIIRFFGIAQDPSFQYSIDGGVTFISSIQFSGLAPDNYSIAIRSQFGCIEFFSVGVGRDGCVEICNNNIDDDGDGLVDCDDRDCNIVEPFNPSIINVIPSDCPSFSNGAFTVSGLPPDVTYTLDGENFQSSPTFTGLAPISYNLGFQDASGCHSGVIVTVPKGNDDDNDNICNEDDRCPGIDDWIIGTVCDDGDPNTENDLVQADCTCAGLPLAPGEICGNGIDDDGDGLIDCIDSDCCGTANCLIPGIQTSVPAEACGARIVITNFDPSFVYSISPTANFTSSTASFDILVAGAYLITASNACTTLSSDVIQISNVNVCTEICDNGIDDDGDGLIDCVDSDCNNMLAVTVQTTDSGCDLTSGRVQITNFDPAVEYVISSNSVPERSPVNGVFEGLIPASYTLVAIGGCETVSVQVTVSVTGGCGEVCDNDIDDDGDGLIDCADPDCRRDLVVETEVQPSACNEATGAIGILNFDVSLEYVLTSPTMPARRALGPFFDNLEANDYTLFTLSQCDTLINSIVVDRTGCQEICDNDIDDDGDGLVDCADPDCEPCSISTDPVLEVSFDQTSISANQLVSDRFCSQMSAANFNEEPGLTLGDNYDYFSEPDNRFSFSFWFKLDSLSDRNHLIISKYGNSSCDTDQREFFIRFNRNRRIEFLYYSRLGGNNFRGIEGDITIDDTCWHHAVINYKGDLDTRDGLDRVEIFLDGVNTNESVAVHSGLTFNSGVLDDIQNGTAHLTIGGASGSNGEPCGFGFGGSLDDVKFYDRELNLDEVINLNNEGLTESIADGMTWCDLCTSVEICDNDIDDDGDGLVDCADPDCSMDLIVDTEVLPSSCDVPTGVINILNFDETLEYVLTSSTMPARTAISSSFDNLEANDYTLFTLSQCDTLVNNIVVTQHPCEETCGNGIDDDVDGLLDCDDPDCSTDESCNSLQEEEDECGPNLTLNFATRDSGCDGTSGEIIILDYNPELSYRLTGSGSTFPEREGSFMGLTPGVYDLTAANNCDSTSITGITLNLEQGCESDAAIGARTVEASIDLTLFLQGACVPEGGKMYTTLNDGGYLPGQQPNTFFGIATPAGQPFADAPWYYEGTEGFESADSDKSSDDLYEYDEDVVDWILISLRTTAEKQSEIWRAAALLHSDGHVEFFDDAVLPNKDKSYYILVEHRNHLPMMSNQQISIVDGMITYDFTTQDSHTSLIGIGQIQDDFGNYMMVAGNGDLIIEVSSDIDINARDLKMWIQNNGANSSYFLEDYDMNGDINIKDRIMWEKNNGLFTTLETK